MLTAIHLTLIGQIKGNVELGFFLISNNFIEYQKSHPSIKDVYKWGQNSQSLKLQWSIKPQIEHKEWQPTTNIQSKKNNLRSGKDLWNSQRFGHSALSKYTTSGNAAHLPSNTLLMMTVWS